MGALHEEVHGSGPVLLLIPGGNGDADGYARIAGPLAQRYTVVGYDRRGFARSAGAAATAGDRLSADTDDVRDLIDKHATGPAAVFGSSSGAIVGLELLRRYPDRVATLVAHEPPLLTLLSDADERLAFIDGVYETYRREGVAAAMAVFLAGIGLERPAGAPPPAPMLARMRANQEYWLEHELRQYARAVPDLDALRAHVDRLVLAGGAESRERGHLPYRPAVVLAERLGAGLVEFPGGHLGYLTHPAAFAERLTGVLSPRAAADRPRGTP